MTTKNIYQKLIEAKQQFKSIKKDTQGFGYKYAQLNQVIDAIQEPLWKNNLDFFQNIKDNKLSTILIDTESKDQVVLTEVDLIAVSAGKTNEVQAWGAGVTYLKRYSIMTAFNLATEDDDGQTAKSIVKKTYTGNSSFLVNQLKQLFNEKKGLLDAAQELKIQEAINSGDTSKIQLSIDWLGTK